MQLAAKGGWVRCHASSLIYHDRIEIKSEHIRLTFLHVILNVIKSLSLISWLLKLLRRHNIFTPNHFNINLDNFI
jgi:undecaprenyl pyrophosphate phosphatase UppP